MSHKTWVYTYNNYTEETINTFKALKVNRHRCCKEIGDNGTPHLQGAITFNRGYRLTQLRKLIPRTHWEVALTSDPENYCIKGEIIIDINDSKQGERNDLKRASDLILNSDLYNVAKELPVTFIKYHKGLSAYKFIMEKHSLPKNQEVKVNVIWGPPGSGKTYQCHLYDDNLYNVPEPTKDGTVWFDGYDGEKTILFDDFYGWIKYHTMLQLLDRYNMKLQIKGGFVNKAWTTVLITSNKPPEEWYPHIEDTSALMRRISKVIKLPKDEESETEVE